MHDFIVNKPFFTSVLCTRDVFRNFCRGVLRVEASSDIWSLVETKSRDLTGCVDWYWKPTKNNQKQKFTPDQLAQFRTQHRLEVLSKLEPNSESRPATPVPSTPKRNVMSS